MARFRAFVSTNMLDTRQTLGTVTTATDDVIVIKIGSTDTYYFGDFTYADDRVTGRVHSVSVYNNNLLSGFLENIDVSASYLFVGSPQGGAIRAALAGNDQVKGSSFDDVLSGFRGNDTLFGGGGADVLHGKDGNDRLAGGGGADVLLGGNGQDILAGDGAADRLQGGAGEDVFVFGWKTGDDRVMDFQNGIDQIKIVSGAHTFADLEISRAGHGTLIEFGQASVLLQGVGLAKIDADDFLF